jgi:ribonuclease E
MASAPAPAPVEKALPKVASYQLPMQDLEQVAQQSGLHWVGSDATKIAEAQAAMAAEAPAAHVPRERQPAASTEAGPLVLVETKRDLRATTLPFENPSA